MLFRLSSDEGTILLRLAGCFNSQTLQVYFVDPEILPARNYSQSEAAYVNMSR